LLVSPPRSDGDCVSGKVGSLHGVSPANGGCDPDEGMSGPVGREGVGGSGSGARGGGGCDGAGGRGGADGEGAGVETVDPMWALSMTRGPLSDGGFSSLAGEGAGSAMTIGPPDSVALDPAAASAGLLASSLPSGSGVGSSRERRRACRPEIPAEAANVRLSCTPRTALLSAIATLEFWPPPTPGSRGRPGRASPTHSAPAKVAVAARPADSKVDRSLEAAEDRMGVRRLFSIFANRRYCSKHRRSRACSASPIRGSSAKPTRSGRRRKSAPPMSA